MNIKEWPEHERPQEKLLARGSSALSDAELLAIIIGSGTQGKNALEIARTLLKDVGSLREVVNAEKAEICRHNGLGKVRYTRLQAAVEISRRILMETVKRGNVFSNADSTRRFLSLKMRNYKSEVFACIFLDNHHRLIEFEELFKGTINAANVHPRELIKRVLYHNASSVILVHNHPSGSSEPSSADRHITDELKQTLGSIDVQVLDHLIVGETITSFAERGLL